jgi:hypothetical protein
MEIGIGLGYASLKRGKDNENVTTRPGQVFFVRLIEEKRMGRSHRKGVMESSHSAYLAPVT